jgi:hypothetical protein
VSIYVFFCGVAEQIELGFISANDDSFCTNYVKPDSTIFKKIIKVSCLALELLLSSFLGGDILKAVTNPRFKKVAFSGCRAI